jgi:magnesium transporter
MVTPTRSKRRRERASQSDGTARAGSSSGDGQQAAKSVPFDSVTAAQITAKPNQGMWCVARGANDQVRKLSSASEVREALQTTDQRVWIDIVSPKHDELKELAQILGLHPLIVEDILEANQRAKIEVYPDAMHLVMFGLSYAGEIQAHEIDIVLGERYLLTAHDDDIDPRGAPFTKREEGFHLAGGPDYVLWAIADWIVDGYFPVFDRLGDEIDDLEADVMRKPNSWIVERLFQVRRDLLLIRHAVNPQREVFNQLTNRDSKLIKPDRIVYFRDIYDHLIRLTDEMDSYRELVSTTLDVYLSQVNNNLSEIMKRLTGVTVVLATIAAISGIFGMSEAGSAFNFTEATGFWIVTATAILIALVIYFYFRRRNWI